MQHTHTISIRWRLIVYSSIAVLVLLTAVVVFLYWAMASEVALNLPWSSFITHERKIFFLVFVSGALLALPLAFLVAGRGLEGLDELTRTVHEITTTSLSQRVDPMSLPGELRALANAFNGMLARIENSFSRLKQLSDDMAHELRTPITNLRVQTEMLLQDEAGWRDALASNLEQLQQISAIIDNMLFLARADNPQISIETTSLEAGVEIRKICDYYEAVADEKRIALLLEGSGMLRANTVMFGRLMSNLVSNALNATPENGQVRISVHHRDSGKTSITVADNGKGIDEAHLPKLFNRFYRVDAARTAGRAGTGLGLAIVKSIVELHQGTIAIASQPREGTVVTLIFPA